MTPRYKTKQPEERKKRVIRLAMRNLFLKRRGNKKGVIPMLTVTNLWENAKLSKAFKVVRNTYFKHGYGSKFTLTCGGDRILRGWLIRKFARDISTKRLIPAGEIIDLRNKIPLKVRNKRYGY